MGKYDVIVIGAGLGGLSTAANLVKEGRKVLVVDQHYVVGGCASTFRRKKFTFDAAVHLMGGCEKGDLIGDFLTDLGIEKDIVFKKVNPMCTVRIGTKEYDIPSDLNELRDKMCEWFPQERQGIKLTFSKIFKIGHILLGTNYAKKHFSQKEKFREFKSIQNLSFEDFLQNYIQEPEALSVLSTLFLYTGTTPKLLSAAYMISVLMSYHNGAFYPKESTQAFANLLRRYIEENDSHVLLIRKIESIKVEENRVIGVKDHKGNDHFADTIVSNIDMKTTFFDLLGEEHLPSVYKKKFQKLKPSCSAIVLYAGIKDDDYWSKNIPHELFVLPEFDRDQSRIYYHPEEKESIPMSICCPSHVGHNLAPEGHAVISATSLCDYDEIESVRIDKGKDYLLTDYLERIEQQLPGFKNRIVRHELATPRTIHRYTLNDKGAMYGWEKRNNQPWLARMGPKSPVDGLYFAGHWTNNVHGVYGVIKSGLMTSEQIIHDTDTTKELV
ncbi:phytoene desaturase family protein [Salibacterium sp. K-3]